MSATIISRTLLTSLATVERLTRQAQTGGQWQEVWTTVSTNVRCNVQYADVAIGNVAQLADRSVGADAVVIRFEPDADVQVDDRVIVGSERYRVVSVNVKTNAWTRVATCREWNDE